MKREKKSSFSRGGQSSSFDRREDKPFRPGAKGGVKKSAPRFRMAPRNMPPKDVKLDYKNFSVLLKFVNDRGRIVSRRMSGMNAKDQRKLAMVIKQARFLALLPSGAVRK